MPVAGSHRGYWAAALFRAGALAMFAVQFFNRAWRHPREWREVLRQMDEAGAKSVLLVVITGLSIGAVLSMQSRGTLSRFGAESVLPAMLALSIVKEIGPVLASLVLAGRLGAGMSSELGSMRVTEQIDAMEVAALNPFHYLVVTRVVACIVMFPALTILCDTVALTGGFIESALATGMDYRLFLDSVMSNLRISDIVVSTGKTSLFGFIVGIVSCHFGYTVRGGTTEVGKAAMKAVVLSSLLILGANVLVVRLILLVPGLG